MSTASDVLDPVEAAKGDIDRSKRLIAETLDDLTLHHSWLETYHREERQRVQRLRRQEAMARLKLRRERAVWTLAQISTATYARARKTAAFLYASSLAFASWAAPRIGATTRSIQAATTRACLWAWRTGYALTIRGFEALKSGLSWSVDASEAAGLTLRRKAQYLALVFASWAAPRFQAMARSAQATVTRATLWTWRTACNLAEMSYAGIKAGFSWSVDASEASGLTFRRKARVFARARVVPLFSLAKHHAAAHMAPTRKRMSLFWRRTRTRTERQAMRALGRIAQIEMRAQIDADWALAAGRGAHSLARTWKRALVRGRRLAANLRSAGVAAAHSAARSRPARRLGVAFARTRRASAAFEKRAAEHMIRVGPRIGRFLSEHRPMREHAPKTSQALIVRPNTSLTCVPRSV